MTGKRRGRQINTILDKRARDKLHMRRTQIEALLRDVAGVEFHGQLEVEGMAGAAVAAAAGGQLPVAAAAAAGAAVVKDRSTKWQPSEHSRVNGPHEVAANGCPCAQGLKFPKWLSQDCGIGLMIVSTVTRFELDNIVPGLLHAMKFQILSMCRTQPVGMSSIFRGIIDADDLGTLRQASTMDAALRAGLPVPRQAPSLAAASSNYDTDKHKVL